MADVLNKVKEKTLQKKYLTKVFPTRALHVILTVLFLEKICTPLALFT